MNKAPKARLTQSPTTPTLIRLTVPMMFGMLSIVALNLIDAFFVGKMGAMQLAALSFTFPVALIMGSIGVGIGTGA
ncbi:MAG: MATE family efflux transporter, partial [Bacteroidetes bacterium]